MNHFVVVALALTCSIFLFTSSFIGNLFYAVAQEAFDSAPFPESVECPDGTVLNDNNECVSSDQFSSESVECPDGTVLNDNNECVSLSTTPDNINSQNAQNNHPPLAQAQSVTTTTDQPLEINLQGTDEDNDDLTATAVSQPSNGELSDIDQSTGTLTYTPDSGFSGTDEFTFKVSDSTQDSETATVAITVGTPSTDETVTMPVDIGQVPLEPNGKCKPGFKIWSQDNNMCVPTDATSDNSVVPSIGASTITKSTDNKRAIISQNTGLKFPGLDGKCPPFHQKFSVNIFNVPTDFCGDLRPENVNWIVPDAGGNCPPGLTKQTIPIPDNPSDICLDLRPASSGSTSTSAEKTHLTATKTPSSTTDNTLSSTKKKTPSSTKDNTLSSTKKKTPSSINTKLNSSKTSKLLVIVSINNNHGGKKKASDFTVQVAGTSKPNPSSFKGKAIPGASIALQSGSYLVKLTKADPHYESKFEGSCKGTVQKNNTPSKPLVCKIKINDKSSNEITTKTKAVTSNLTNTTTSSLKKKTTENDFVDIHTSSIGKPSVPIKGTLPVFKYPPNIVSRGHVTLNLPSNDIQLVVTNNLTTKRPQHAVAVNLTKVLDIRAGQTLYQADLQKTMKGVNPFTKKPDTVSGVTDLLLLNNGSKSLKFSKDNSVTTSLVFASNKKGTSPATISSNRSNQISLKKETINITGSDKNKSIFSSKGIRELVDTKPFIVTKGNLSLNIPSSTDIKLVAAHFTSKAPQHAVTVNLTKVSDIRAGQTLYQADLQKTMKGVNPFTKKHDTVSSVTDLLLLNNGSKPLVLNKDHNVNLTLDLDSTASIKK